jgi:hypothetical protein
MIKGAFDIANDPFDEVKMSGAGCMHEKACLLNGVREIGSSEG